MLLYPVFIRISLLKYELDIVYHPGAANSRARQYFHTVIACQSPQNSSYLSMPKLFEKALFGEEQ